MTDTTDRPESDEKRKRVIAEVELGYATVEALERAFPTIGDLERDG